MREFGSGPFLVFHGSLASTAAALVAVAASLACPVQAHGETLKEALGRAYVTSPQLNADRARQRAEDENVPRALSGYFPNVSATGGFGVNYQRARPGGTITDTSPTLGLTLDQNVYDFGRTAATVRSAESAILAGRATLIGTEQTVLLSAVTAYMNVLRDASLVELQVANVENLTETLRIARRRFDLGDARRTDSAQAESRLARGQADLAVARTNLATSRGIYRQVIGQEPRSLAFPTSVETLLPRSLTAAVASALEVHPSIRSATHAVDVATSDVRVAKTALYPSIRLGGSLQETIGRSRSDQDTTPPLTIGPQVNAPIYDGGATPALVRQAKELVGQRRAELEAVRDDVRADLRTAWGALDAARAAVPAGEAAVSANEVALAGVRREALEGQRTTLEVLNAQQELLNARTLLVTSRRDVVVTSYAVLSAVGSLTANRLRLAVGRYRAETHYEQVRDLRGTRSTPDGR